MAYVRQRGKQLAIVQGRRNSESQKVEQQILFTIYSRAEARALLGHDGKDGRHRFESLMRHQYPELRFDWKRIRSAISDRLDALPETYESKADRLQGQFRSDLCALTRQLALADPQWLVSAARLIAGHRHELAFLKDLIDWRLQTCDQEESPWNRDDPFCWQLALAGREVPSDVEEMASELFEKGCLDEAESIFRLLIEAFEGYAEGHNYLGLIALDRDELDEAIEHFERTIELGRRKFARRISRKQYWSRLETRPYMRGLQNQCLALIRAARYDEALSLCDRLERECGDDMTAQCHRASIHLNTGRWEESLSAANWLHRIYAEENLIGALAAFELGRREESTWRFLHGTLNRPRAARMILGLKTPPPSSLTREEVTDHNAGVDLCKDLGGFLAAGRTASRRYFRALLRRPEVEALLEEKARVGDRWRGPHEPEAEWRAAFDRMHLMETAEFARQQAKALFRSPGEADGSRKGITPNTRRCGSP